MYLTDEQKRAIEAPLSNNMFILACAGSGKTTVMAKRIVYLLKNSNVSPEAIVSFTFTEKAAKELKNRVYLYAREELGENFNGLANMYVGTVHAYCLKLLHENIVKYSRYSVLDEIKQRIFISKHHKILIAPLKERIKQDITVRNYTNVIGNLNENFLSIEKVDQEWIDALNEYNNLFNKNKFFDFALVLRTCVQEIMTNQAFKTNIKNTIKYLFVDEYQDINPIQEKIIEEFHNLGVKICAVGDDDQTIYQFRGSDSSIIRNFTKKYNVSEKYEFILDYNFRSTDKIVSLSNTLIKHNVQRIAKNVKIGNHNPKFEQNDISYYTPGNEEEEYDFICKKILFFKKTGYNFSDISILSRTNGSISKISNYLKKFNIPFNVKGFNNLFEYEEIMALSEIFQQLICQNINKDNFIQLLKTINNNATKKNLEDALKLISNTMLSLSTLKVFNMQVFYHELIMNLGISEEIGNADHEIKMYALGKFSTLISDFEMINYNSLPESKIKNFSWFLEHDAKTGYSDGMNENTCNQNNSVNVMTVHASKGLEFPIVFILDLNEGRFPNTRLMTDVLLFNYIDEEKIENSQRYIVDIEDERKLFYVAITRSMKHLILTTSTKKHSMFLDECLKSKLVTPDNLTNYEIHNIVKTKLSNTPIILNFSVLQDYFNCPYKFKLSFLYGFASEFSDTWGYGASIHSCINDVIKQYQDGTVLNNIELDKIIENNTHLPYARGAVQKHSADKIKSVVQEFYAKNFNELKEYQYSEKPIEINLGGNIIVNGKIDLVRTDSISKEIFIIDFKTSKRIPAEEIKTGQLDIYAVGYELLTGHKPDFIEIRSVDNNLKPAIKPVDSNTSKKVFKNIENAVSDIRSNCFKRITKDCENCRHKYLCQQYIKS